VASEIKRWIDYGDITAYYPSDYNPEKIRLDEKGGVYMAGFDLDGTLMISSTGQTFIDDASSSGDNVNLRWQPIAPNEYKILKQLSEDGWGVVIFSNQSNPRVVNKVKARVLEFFFESNFSCPVYLALRKDTKVRKDPYRKPSTGMISVYLQWIKTVITKKIAQSSSFSMKIENAQLLRLGEAAAQSLAVGSFYCGDAAGSESKSPWYQWADTDRLLAKNAGIAFYEPEQILGKYDFPLILQNINLIITCGQYGSGWENCIDAKLGDPRADRKLIILDTKTVLEKSNGSIIVDHNDLYLVYGLHPTKAIRDQIRSKFAMKQVEKLHTVSTIPNSFVAYFAKPSKYKDLTLAQQYEFSKYFEADGRTNTSEKTTKDCPFCERSSEQWFRVN
jgi:DNA 3'-phosphatase